MMNPSQKRARSFESSPRGVNKIEKKVGFVEEEPTVHLFDQYNGHTPPAAKTGGGNEGSTRASQLTEEMTVLSTLHGKARRELRDISKHDLKTVMKYGVKSEAHTVKGDQRWKFEFGNTVYITDNTCRKEITCFKKAIKVEPANITQTMIDNHKKAEMIMREDPHLVSVSYFSVNSVNCIIQAIYTNFLLF